MAEKSEQRSEGKERKKSARGCVSVISKDGPNEYSLSANFYFYFFFVFSFSSSSLFGVAQIGFPEYLTPLKLAGNSFAGSRREERRYIEILRAIVWPTRMLNSLSRPPRQLNLYLLALATFLSCWPSWQKLADFGRYIYFWRADRHHRRIQSASAKAKDVFRNTSLA